MAEEFRQPPDRQMKVLDGCRTPLELFGGVKLADVKVLDGLWRVNSQ